MMWNRTEVIALNRFNFFGLKDWRKKGDVHFQLIEGHGEGWRMRLNFEYIHQPFLSS